LVRESICFIFLGLIDESDKDDRFASGVSDSADDIACERAHWLMSLSSLT